MADIPIPTKAALKEAWRQAEKIHTDHLKQHGVKLPKWGTAGTARAYWLAILRLRSGEEVHKNEISEIVRRYLPKIAPDQQVRHLKGLGWNVEEKGDGRHKISNWEIPHPGFQSSTGDLTNADFETLKKEFKNCCATCGAKEGEVSPKYPGRKAVELQKGHCDPEKGRTIDNIIPQCHYCNSSYKRDFVFYRNGRVKAVASIGPVRRASKSVQDEIRKFLKTNASRQD